MASKAVKGLLTAAAVLAQAEGALDVATALRKASRH
jgi:hypothetical protein